VSSTKVYLSTLGRPVDPADAQISVFDRGFLYGDSVYETMRTSGGNPVEIGRHLDRLTRSAAGIGLEIPFSHADIEAAIAQTHAASGNAESYERVIVTRGAGPIALDTRKSEDPTLVIVVQPLKLPEPEQYERGLSVVVVGVEKAGGGLVDPGIKTGNYLNNILALKMAIARGGEDAIMCNGAGDIAEGATSNVFLVEGGTIRTPHLETGLLAGITRQAVFELATEAGHPPEETKIRPEQLRGADEVFLTSSIRGIMPVTQVDGQAVGQGGIGPVTRDLMQRYEAYLRRWAE
jgi:branched-chain amino acid aminotransferase